MGTDIDWKIIQGINFDSIEVPDEYDGDIDQFIDDLGLDYISPYYDSDIELQVFGILLYKGDSPKAIDPEDLLIKVIKAKEKLKELGITESKTYVSQHIW